MSSMNNQRHEQKYQEIDVREYLVKILHEEDAELSKGFNVLKAEISSETGRKCSELKQRVKHKKEILQVAGIYSSFIIILALFLWNYLLCGFNQTELYFLAAAGILSVVLLCCIPLLLIFKCNIFERRYYQNEIKKIR